jgi:aspartate racemase
MIGIVGGVGPMAGADLFKKITEQSPARTDQEHLPVIMMSFPHRIADRTEYLEGKVLENPGIQLAKICFELSKAGVTVAGIPCNTAHAPAIFDKMLSDLRQLNCNIRIVHMVNETVNHIKQNFPIGTKVGILSTNGSYKQKIYFDKLVEAGFYPVVPDEKIQSELVHASVYDQQYGIKTQQGRITEKALSQLEGVIEMMKNQDTQALILGCTEISYALSTRTDKDITHIDPTSILASALIAEYNRSKKKAPQ